LSEMREIDPQFGNPHEGVQQDPRLTRALRGLAASSHRGAPADVGASLATAFRRHHARRRLVRRVSVGAIAAGLAVVVGLMSLGSHAPHQVPGKTVVREQPSGVPAKAPEDVIVAKAVPTPPRPVRKRAKPQAANSSLASSSRQFLALPGYDPGVPADELRVVRVQVPASALWQMGAPVSPDSGARKFTADFVVSQDGTPYAVRLVQ
ncbi:MAG TPA: hypothetical protein VKV30_05610, partial [Candidatus Angelobacter sp.]|nr:hypothetical protein [Candidatus Angelobacter sp.]